VIIEDPIGRLVISMWCLNVNRLDHFDASSRSRGLKRFGVHVG